MSITPWVAFLQRVVNGDPVDAPNDSKPIDGLAQRTQNLKELLDALRAQQLLLIPDVALDSTTVVGTPVYFDDLTNTYRPAVATATGTSASVTALPTAFIAGVVTEKSAPTRGTIGAFGQFADMDSLAAWNGLTESGTAVAGMYYLSSITAGKLSTNPGSLGVLVGHLDSNGVFFIKSQAPAYGSHVHYRFTLSPLPAIANPITTGSSPTDISRDGGTGAWTINVPDSGERGWLPASTRPVQERPVGLPAGAFWYNLDHPDDASLRAVFPPIPVDSVVFLQGGLVQPSGRVIVNQFGIWWTQNINGPSTAAPWSENVLVAPASEPDIDFWFSRILLATDGGLVRSLVVSPASGLTGRFVLAGGATATSGDLQLVLDALTTSSDTDAGVLAVKSVTGSRFTRGPVVTGIKTTGGLVATSTNGDGVNGFHGSVTVSLLDSALTQGVAEVADLQNARIDSLSGLQSVSLVPGRVAAPVFTINVSPSALATSNLQLAFWIYSSAGGTLPSSPELLLKYKILAPTAPGTPVAIPGSWTALPNLNGANTGITSLVAGSYSCTTFGATFVVPNVPAGATVLLQITRGADAFSGVIGIPRLAFKLVAP